MSKNTIVNLNKHKYIYDDNESFFYYHKIKNQLFNAYTFIYTNELHKDISFDKAMYYETFNLSRSFKKKVKYFFEKKNKYV